MIERFHNHLRTLIVGVAYFGSSWRNRRREEVDKDEKKKGERERERERERRQTLHALLRKCYLEALGPRDP
jgi:hypothetical protein